MPSLITSESSNASIKSSGSSLLSDLERTPTPPPPPSLDILLLPTLSTLPR